MSDKIPKPRYHFLDAYRGLCIVLMVLHHTAFDLAVHGFIPVWLLVNPVIHILQPFFAGSFIVMSGASCRFSKNNFKRGLLIAFFAVGVSAVTYIFTPDMFISFGILHFLSAASLLYSLLGKLFEKYEKILAIFCIAVFFILFFIFPIYINSPGAAFLGFPTATYSSADYYPILPWIFLFFFGSYLGGIIKNSKMPACFYSFRCPFFEKAGKYSLIIYLAHQPVLYGLVSLLSNIK